MIIELSSELNLDLEVRELVFGRVHSALDRFENRIERVVVVGRDHNGPKGGIDKSCRATVHLIDGESITVTDQSTDFISAVSLAAERLGRSVARTFERRSSAQRRNVSFAGPVGQTSSTDLADRVDKTY